MNYLLVMPKRLGAIDHFNIFPIGLAYVSASLKQAGFNVVTVNLDNRPSDTHTELENLIKSHDIDVICTGGLSRDCRKLKEVIDAARSIKPEIICVVGGGIISSDPQPAMRVLDADVGVIGEGEITICELANALDSGLPYDTVPGLVFRNHNKELITTTSRKEVEDIDSLPFPDFEGFDYGQWVKISGSGLVLTDRSCPFRCTFCFHPSGEKYRQRTLDSIFKEIDYQVEQYGITCIGLSSELFSTSRQRVIEFCNRIKSYNVSWSCCLRVCDVDPEMLRMMKSSGCVNIVFGFESADNTVLKSMRKGITVEQIEHALNLTYEAELMIEGGFIFGDINETMETVTNTLNFWQRHNGKHYLNLAMISVFPGSFLYKHACDTGIIADREQFLRAGCQLVNISKLTDTEYHQIRSQVTELRFHPHVPSGDVHIEAITPAGECSVTVTCRKCAARTHTTVSFWFGKEIRCPACGLTNFIDPFLKALHESAAFFANLPDDQCVAIWGAGGVFYKLSRIYTRFASERFVLIDVNTELQGLSICGKLIHTPDVIDSNKVQVVIIAALSRKDEIAAVIRKEHPTVKCILTPDFDISVDGIIPVMKQI